MKTDSAVPLKGIIAVFFGAFLLWLVGISLSTKLAQNKEDGHSPVASRGNGGEPPMEMSPEVVQLEKDLQANPNDLELRITLAERLTTLGAQAQDPRLLMRAVEAYLKVIDKDPKNTAALLGLANVSFESGVFDRAADYFRQYLEIVPDDHKARTDLALTLIQIGNSDEAISNLQQILKSTPNVFAARMGLALAYRVAGKQKEALKEADLAKPLAPDEEGRAMLQRFIEEVKNPSTETKATTSEEGGSGEKPPVAIVSPAAAVNEFFRSHPIVGPKVVSIAWPSPSLARVEVKDFPVDQMPEFAKQKFLGNVRKMLASLPDAVTVEMVDQGSKKTLLEIKQ